MGDKMTKYICLEGGEGTYKTTTAKALAEHYRALGLVVLETKEPGTPHLPVTMALRNLMLNNDYDESLTKEARELISQTIRSIHMEKLIFPAIHDQEYDVIIQDRGLLSGRVYATACGNKIHDIHDLENFIFQDYDLTLKLLGRKFLYDSVFVFSNQNGLELAKTTKNEFGNGDAMESRGELFHTQVHTSFDEISKQKTLHKIAEKIIGIDVHGKTTQQILLEMTNF